MKKLRHSFLVAIDFQSPEAPLERESVGRSPHFSSPRQFSQSPNLPVSLFHFLSISFDDRQFHCLILVMKQWWDIRKSSARPVGVGKANAMGLLQAAPLVSPVLRLATMINRPHSPTCVRYSHASVSWSAKLPLRKLLLHPARPLPVRLSANRAATL